MPSKYATTSNVPCDENNDDMTSHVRHSERGSIISDYLVVSNFILNVGASLLK